MYPGALQPASPLDTPRVSPAGLGFAGSGFAVVSGFGVGVGSGLSEVFGVVVGVGVAVCVGVAVGF